RHLPPISAPMASGRRQAPGSSPPGTVPPVAAVVDQGTSYRRRLLLLPPRDLLAFLAHLGEADGDRLLAALYLAAAPTPAALGGAALVAAHFAFHLFARAAGIFSFSFLGHAILHCRNGKSVPGVSPHAQDLHQTRWKAVADATAAIQISR